MALRFDPKSQLFAVESLRRAADFRLLGSLAGTTWFRGPDNLLYRTDPQLGEPVTVETGALPPEIAGKYEPQPPFGLGGGAVWFRLKDKKDPQRGMIAGYDPVARVWTPGHAIPSFNPNPPTCLEAGGRVYLPTVETDAAVLCYDPKAAQWSIAAPSAPQSRGHQTLTVVSVDDEGGIWMLDGAMRSLMYYQRRSASWQLFECRPVSGSARPATKWCDLATRFPGDLSRRVEFRDRNAQMDPASRYSRSRHIPERTYFGSRLHLVHRTTRKWEPGVRGAFRQSDAPVDRLGTKGGFSGEVLSGRHRAGRRHRVGDGVERLLSARCRGEQVGQRFRKARSPGFRPGPQSDRCAPGSLATPFLEIAEVVPDGDSVWLLPRQGVNQGGKLERNPLLVRSRSAHGALREAGSGLRRWDRSSAPRCRSTRAPSGCPRQMASIDTGRRIALGGEWTRPSRPTLGQNANSLQSSSTTRPIGSTARMRRSSGKSEKFQPVAGSFSRRSQA